MTSDRNLAGAAGENEETSVISSPQIEQETTKSNKTVIGLFVKGLLIALIFLVSFNVYSQWQLKGVIESAQTVKDRLSLYSTSFQMSKPSPNSDGFETYNGFYGEAAWDEFVANRLRSLATGTSGEFAVLLFQLERQSVLGIFSKSAEAKRQLIEYYKLFDDYLKETADCYTSKCYTEALRSLNGVDGKWGIVMLTVRDAKPLIDLFGLNSKVEKLLS
jgi:hypothetical protein